MGTFTREQILAMPPARRWRLKLRRRRGPLMTGATFTRQQLIDALKKYGTHSREKYLKLRQPDEPTKQYFIKEFGSWIAATEEALGPSPNKEPERDRAEYMVNCVIEFGLWTKKKWLKAHFERPDVVPSERAYRWHWGTFDNLVAFARRSSLKAIIADYFELKQRIGHWPTLAECKASRIDLSLALQLMGGKHELDGFLIRTEKCAPKQR